MDKLRAIKGNKKRIDERIDLLNQRAELQSQFIAKKQAVRALLTLLKSKGEGAAAWKENDLNALQVRSCARRQPRLWPPRVAERVAPLASPFRRRSSGISTRSSRSWV